jgi:8-oxo-dGTP diphosphatase
MPKTVICEDIDRNTYEVPASELYFRPSVYGVVVQDGKVLLSKQWNGYDFPGGGMDLGETIEEALVREVKEETGLDVRVGKVLACENSFFKMPFTGKYAHCILMYYLCEVTGGEITTAHFSEDEKRYADMPEWIPLDRVPTLKFCNSVDSVRLLQGAGLLR